MAGGGGVTALIFALGIFGAVWLAAVAWCVAAIVQEFRQ